MEHGTADDADQDRELRAEGTDPETDDEERDPRADEAEPSSDEATTGLRRVRHRDDWTPMVRKVEDRQG